MLPSDTPISGNALALLASSFRPVTADQIVPAENWNGGLCVMPGTRNHPPAKPMSLHTNVKVIECLGGKREVAHSL